jgi:hypothetical protein
VMQGMWWALLDYFRTSPAEFQAVDPRPDHSLLRDNVLTIP